MRFPVSARLFQIQHRSLALLGCALVAAAVVAGCTSVDRWLVAMPTDAELASLRDSDAAIEPPAAPTPEPAELPAELPAESNPEVPRFFPSDIMAKLELTTSRGDPADVYYPRVKEPAPELRFPIALLLQGLNVDKAHYSRYAQRVARYGFVVVVPNHRTSIRGSDELFAQVGQVTDTLLTARAIDRDPGSPLFDRIDSSQLVLLGHSHGGMMGLDAIRGACDVPFCVGEYSLPDELKAAVFFGTALWEDGEYLRIDNTSIPVALIAGDRDSLIGIEETRQTYAQIVTPPRALIELRGVNHYGITDTDNPSGSPLEQSESTIAQSDSITAIADWSGRFLRGHLRADRAALRSVYRFEPERHGVGDVPTAIESQLR